MNLIFADFMKYEGGNLILTCLGTKRDLEAANITLEIGMNLVFYEDDVDAEGNRDDLVVRGVVDYDEANGRWVAAINFDEIKNMSLLTDDEKSRLGL
ncbi:hypothetical protein BH10ACI3_BH10ACI3_23460 [soil metagenome]